MRVGRPAGQLLVGLVAYAVSMALIIRAGLGAMPWDVLHQGLAERLPLSFGAVTALVGLVVLVCWIPLGQRPGVGTVANVVVISAAVDPALALLALLPDPLPLAGRVTLLVAGVGLNGLATALYVGVGWGPGPRDGLMTGLVARTGAPLRLVRTAIELVVVGSGWLLGGTVGVGTVLYALAVGPLVHAWLPRFRTGTAPDRPAASATASGGSGTPGTPRTSGSRAAVG